MDRLRWLWPLLLLPLLSACSGTYYRAMESLGIEKREIMVDRVEEARDAQDEAKEQFRSALEQFSSVVGFQGGELEALYERLRDELEASEARAQAVRERIAGVEDVSEALFSEWEAELDEYTSAELSAISAQQLRDTRAAYTELMRKMHRAERTMGPVLAAFRDQVLFLKHNLNARAVAALEGEYAGIDREIRSLVAAMEASIREADAFIRRLRS